MGLTDDIERLKAIPLLSVLDEEGLRLIAFNAELLSANDGQTVFFIGDHAPGALLIIDGSLSKIELVDGEMKERARFESGTIVDVYTLISDVRRSYTAKAVGDLTYMVLDRSTFLRVMKNYPELAQRIQDYLSHDIKRVASSLSDVAARLDYLN